MSDGEGVEEKIRLRFFWGRYDFRRRTTNFTPIYIFVGGHLASKVMSVCEKKTPTSEKMHFLVVIYNFPVFSFFITTTPKKKCDL